MGRTLIGEPQLMENVYSSLKNVKSGVGIIIGQLTSQKDYVVHLTRTPCEEEEKKTDPITLEKADDKWIATHARQVMRMLTGGLHVVGIFAYGPPDAIKNAQATLRKAVFAVHKVELKEQYQGSFASTDSINDRYVVQICSMSKKATCRTFDVRDPKCAGKPGDFKSQSFLDKWHKLETSMLVDTTFNIDKCQGSVNLEKQMQKGFEPLMDNIMSSVALINNTMRDPSDSVASSSEISQGGGKGKKKQKAVSQESFQVRLLCSPIKYQPNQETSKQESIASLSIRGTLYGVAFVHSKATVKEAVEAIKYDFVRSLQARYELLCEDLLQSEESNDTRIIYEMPIRVFTQVNDGLVTLCDYLFPEEELEYSISRLAEFLGLTVSEDDVNQDCERFPNEEDIQAKPIQSSAVTSAGTARQPSQTKSPSEQKGPNMVTIAVSTAIAALAAVLSYMFLDN